MLRSGPNSLVETVALVTIYLSYCCDMAVESFLVFNNNNNKSVCLFHNKISGWKPRFRVTLFSVVCSF